MNAIMNAADTAATTADPLPVEDQPELCPRWRGIVARGPGAWGRGVRQQAGSQRDKRHRGSPECLGRCLRGRCRHGSARCPLRGRPDAGRGGQRARRGHQARGSGAGRARPLADQRSDRRQGRGGSRPLPPRRGGQSHPDPPRGEPAGRPEELRRVARGTARPRQEVDLVSPLARPVNPLPPFGAGSFFLTSHRYI